MGVGVGWDDGIQIGEEGNREVGKRQSKNRTMKSWVGVGMWVGGQRWTGPRDAVGMLTYRPDTACAKVQVQNESRTEGTRCGGHSPDFEPPHFQPVHFIWILFFHLFGFLPGHTHAGMQACFHSPAAPYPQQTYASLQPLTNKRTGSLWRWKNPWKDPSRIFQTSLHHRVSSPIFYLLPTNSSKL